jgi:hypothetical protein
MKLTTRFLRSGLIKEDLADCDNYRNNDCDNYRSEIYRNEEK